jgi:phospholipid transport system substrate-binding protein
VTRRDALLVIAACVARFATPASAADAPPADVTAPIRAFYAALLDVMKRAKALGIRGRYDTLAPVVAATFDLPAMTRISVGPRWTSIPK